jgi:plastocyanin
VALSLVAQGIQFDTACLVAPAGQDFQINFDNKDAGTPHNVAIAKDSAYADFIFTGDLVTGPKATVYDVTKSSGPLDAGTYYFRCDVHPTMAGTLEVVKVKGK